MFRKRRLAPSASLDKLAIPHWGREAVFPAWVYAAMEYDLLQQMQARLAPERHDFNVPGRPPLSIIGWKLGDSTFNAPGDYGPCTQETYWVVAHLTPERVAPPELRPGAPILPNLVSRVYSPEHPDSEAHWGHSLTVHLPTACPPKFDLRTPAGDLHAQLQPRTFPEQFRNGGVFVLQGQVAHVCLSGKQDDLSGALQAFLTELPDVLRRRAWAYGKEDQ